MKTWADYFTKLWQLKKGEIILVKDFDEEEWKEREFCCLQRRINKVFICCWNVEKTSQHFWMQAKPKFKHMNEKVEQHKLKPEEIKAMELVDAVFPYVNHEDSNNNNYPQQIEKAKECATTILNKVILTSSHADVSFWELVKNKVKDL